MSAAPESKARYDLDPGPAGSAKKVENTCKQVLRKDTIDFDKLEFNFKWVVTETKKLEIFPTDDAVRKSVYLSVKEIAPKWSMPVRGWGMASVSWQFSSRID